MESILQDNYLDLLQDGLVIINPGCDWITLNTSLPVQFLEEKLSQLTTDHIEAIFEINRMQYTIKDSSTKLHMLGDISVNIDGNSYKIMQYKKFLSLEQQKMFKLYGQITFYGVFFRLLNIGKLIYSSPTEFINNFFYDDSKHLQECKISRYDYKIDFCYDKIFSIPHKPDIVKPYKGKGVRYNAEYDKGIVDTGWTCGNKANKSFYLRFYDKLEESKKIKQLPLYSDYFAYKSVVRLEGQFHTKFNKFDNGIPCKLKDIELMEHKARAFFLLEKSEIFKKCLYQYRQLGNPLLDAIRKLPYLKGVISRLIKIAEAGINPYLLFTEEAGVPLFKDKIRGRLKDNNTFIDSVLFSEPGEDEEV